MFDFIQFILIFVLITNVTESSRDRYFLCEKIPNRDSFNATYVEGKVQTTNPPLQILSNTTLQKCYQQCKLNLHCQMSEFIPDDLTTVITGRCQFYSAPYRYVKQMDSNFIMLLLDCPPSNNYVPNSSFESGDKEGYWVKYVNFRPSLHFTNIFIEESPLLADQDNLGNCTKSRFCGYLLEQNNEPPQFYSYWTDIPESTLIYRDNFTFYKWIFFPINDYSEIVKTVQCGTHWSNISVTVGRNDVHPDDNLKYAAFFQTMNLSACFVECSELNCGRVFFNLSAGMCLLESHDQREETCGDRYNLLQISFTEFNVTYCNKEDTSVPSSECLSHIDGSTDILHSCMVIKRPEKVRLYRNSCDRMVAEFNFTRKDLPFESWPDSKEFGNTYKLGTGTGNNIWVIAETDDALCHCHFEYCEYFQNENQGEYFKQWGQFQFTETRIPDTKVSIIVIGAIKPSCSCSTVDHCAHVAREGQMRARITKDSRYFPNFIIGKSGIVLEGRSTPSLHDKIFNSAAYIAVVGNYTNNYPDKFCISSVKNMSQAIKVMKNGDYVDLVSNRFPDMVSMDERLEDFYVLTNSYMGKDHSHNDADNLLCALFLHYFIYIIGPTMILVAVICSVFSLFHSRGCRYLRFTGLTNQRKFHFRMIPLLNCESQNILEISLSLMNVSLLSQDNTIELSKYEIIFLADKKIDYSYLFKLVTYLIDYSKAEINFSKKSETSSLITTKLQQFSDLLNEEISNFLILLEPTLKNKNSKPILIIAFLPNIDFHENVIRLLLYMTEEKCLCSYIVELCQSLSTEKQREYFESIDIGDFRSEEEMSEVNMNYFYQKYCRLHKEDIGNPLL